MTDERRHTAHGIHLLVQLLLIEQRGIDPLAVRPEGWAEPVRGWLAAAAALTAGEAKRALAVLADPVPEETYDDLVTRTLRTAAVTMDVNWGPGGVIGWAPTSEDESALLRALDGTHARLTILARDPGLRLAAFLAGRYLPDLFSARALLANAHTIGAQPAEVVEAVGGMEEAREAVRWFDGLPCEIAEGGLVSPVAYHLLVASDLRVRAADRRQGEEMRRQALQHMPQNDAFAAMSALLAGDAELEVPGAAERCLLVGVDRRALKRAAGYYVTAEALFRKAGTARGRAAVALRLAHIARLRRRPEDSAASLDRALALAEAGGDGACAALVRVHRMLDGIDAGHALPLQDVDRVRRWASTVGSGSWLRGMADLAAVRAGDWSRRGEVLQGRQAGDLAERLMDAHSDPEGGRRGCE
ncbi:hypothetical protein ACFY41_01820 [Streptomyces syringium]|uniref:hypothetical protein n=1 Tax=Streptomyces syringium TaxID=76729 RepID=UPI00367B725F